MWTPNGSCILPPLPLEMNNHPTLDLVYGTLVTCYLTTCYSLVNPVDSRRDSNSRAVIDDKSEGGGRLGRTLCIPELFIQVPSLGRGYSWFVAIIYG